MNIHKQRLSATALYHGPIVNYRLLSTCYPSSVCVLTGVTTLLFPCAHKFAFAHHSFCLVPSSKHLVLSAFKTKQLASIQSYNGFEFVVSDWFISATHLPVVYSIKSSAHISKHMSDILRIESFIKSKGPSIETCGTPIFTRSGSDSSLSYFIH